MGEIIYGKQNVYVGAGVQNLFQRVQGRAMISRGLNSNWITDASCLIKLKSKIDKWVKLSRKTRVSRCVVFGSISISLYKQDKTQHIGEHKLDQIERK